MKYTINIFVKERGDNLKVKELEKIMQASIPRKDELKNAMNSVKKAIEVYNENMLQLSQYILVMSEKFRESLKWIEDFRKYNKDFFKNIHDQLKQFGKLTQRYSTIMVELGWPPYPDIYPEEVVEIVELYDEFGVEMTRKKLDEYFVERFDKEELNNMLRNWQKKEWYDKRIPILEESLEAHFSGNYYASISTLLPQIEGIIADGFGHIGEMNGFLLKNFLEKLLDAEGIYKFDESIQTFYWDIILAGFEHGSEPESFLSRHAILHGGDTDFGTRTNSLKSILLFDYLQEKFRLVSLKKGKAYHKLSCYIVENHRESDWLLYNNKYEAEKDGKSPCKICKPKTNSF